MNNFDRAGEIERSKIQLLADKLKCTATMMAPRSAFDAYLVKDMEYSIIEAKVRTMSNDRFDSAMIEKDKYDRLLELHNRFGLSDKVLYVFFYNDGSARIWNLLKINPVWSRMELVRNTVIDNGSKYKTIYNIPNEQGKLIWL